MIRNDIKSTHIVNDQSNRFTRPQPLRPRPRAAVLPPVLGDRVVSKGGVQVVAHEIDDVSALREHDALERAVVVLGRVSRAVATPLVGLTQFTDSVDLGIWDEITSNT